MICGTMSPVLSPDRKGANGFRVRLRKLEAMPSAPTPVTNTTTNQQEKRATPVRTFGLNDSHHHHKRTTTGYEEPSLKMEPSTESSLVSELFEQERIEVRRRLEALNQRNLIEKFSNVQLTEFQDDDETENERPAQEEQPKVVRTFSADESVVEVTKERFEPKFVRDINFEVLKHPDTSLQMSVGSSSKKRVQLSASPRQRQLPEFPLPKRSTVSVNLGQQLQAVSAESVQMVERAVPSAQSKPLRKTNSVGKLGEPECRKQPAESKIRRIVVNGKCYQVLNRIGHGGSSVVYQVYSAEMQRTLALKLVDLTKSDGAVLEGFRSEIKVLERLRHCSRVVRIYDHQFRANHQQLLIVMEKGDADLANVMKSHFQGGETGARSLSPHVIKLYWQEMLEAVREIHRENIVHADLKPVNFILVAGKLKLIDFGIAKPMTCNQTNVYNDIVVGTMDYMAPESIQKQNNKVKYNKKIDIWSLGIILYNLVYGVTPFSHLESHFQKGMAIINGEIEYRPVADPLLLDVIQKCLQKDPGKRPTAEELLAHPYLKPPGKASGLPAELANQIGSLTPESLKRFAELVKSISKK